MAALTRTARGAYALVLALFCVSTGAQPFPAEEITKGADLFAQHCAACHGNRMAAPEWAADLRKFPKTDRLRFIDTVTHGKSAMPPWSDVLKPDEIGALWAYLVAGEKN